MLGAYIAFALLAATWLPILYAFARDTNIVTLAHYLTDDEEIFRKREEYYYRMKGWLTE